MPNYIDSSPLWIDSPEKLASILPELDRSEYLSIDTESNSLYVYYEQVCLIQISVNHCDYLIDPLALKDLNCLGKYFANPNQKKIFHASEYDIICLKRDFNFQFANLFDTMIAARILGEESVGLAALLKTRLGLELDKKYQRSNWALRPLPKEMLNYASQDSCYLFDLHQILTRELQEKGLWELAQEDFKLACEVEAHAGAPIPQNCWKVAGSTTINGSEAAVLQLLCDLRENIASKQNIPVFKVISNETLLKLIKELPQTISDLKSVRGVSPRLIDRQGSEILEILKMKESIKPLRKIGKVRPSEAYLSRLDSLREWRKRKGKQLKVESDVILPRNFVETVAGENPTNLTDLQRIMEAIPWRFSRFGEEIINVLHKQEA